MKRNHSRPAAPTADGGVPVEFPLVRMNVHDDGAMTVLVDGEVYAPPEHAPAWHRGSFSTVLDAITTRLNSAVKVIVVEHDGSTFTDIVTPRRSIPAVDPAVHGAPEGPPCVPQLVSVTGSGFLAGEEVAVAPVVAHAGAAPDGRIQALLASDRLPTGVVELLLLGRVSGAVQIVRAVS